MDEDAVLDMLHREVVSQARFALNAAADMANAFSTSGSHRDEMDRFWGAVQALLGAERDDFTGDDDLVFRGPNGHVIAQKLG